MIDSQTPNLLIFVADGMQAEAVEPASPCRTPVLDALAARGVRFRRAHTTCPTCSPARASLMTGLLPHNHGVLEVEHGRDRDQCELRTEHPHFAQLLAAAGYQTSYFGKWHIERSHDAERFGWRESALKSAEHVSRLGQGDSGPQDLDLDSKLRGYIEGPAGYRKLLHWAVTDTPLEERYPGLTVGDAQRSLDRLLANPQPWCCLLSFAEPNEALVVGRPQWQRYDPSSLPLPGNFFDDLTDRPALYRREQAIGRALDEAHWRAARACYFGRISEVDQLVGRVLEQVESAGRLRDTIVIFTADHGRYVGAHGFDAHNVGPFEEIYRIPLILAGPGVARGAACDAFVSIADLGETLCSLGSAGSLDTADASSFRSLCADPGGDDAHFQSGYAEYHGTRFPLMQRILWRDAWKFVFNGFDFDELYDLESDPYETRNRVHDADQQPRVRTMMSEIWRYVRATNDRTINESHYYSLRLACVGPDAADTSG